MKFDVGNANGNQNDEYHTQRMNCHHINPFVRLFDQSIFICMFKPKSLNDKAHFEICTYSLFICSSIDSILQVIQKLYIFVISETIKMSLYMESRRPFAASSLPNIDILISFNFYFFIENSLKLPLGQLLRSCTVFKMVWSDFLCSHH